MKAIRYIDIRINEDGTIIKKNITELSVAAENEEYLCVNDKRYTTLSKKKKGKNSIDTHLDEIRVSFNKDDFWIKYFGFVNISCYSTKSLKVTENKINKRLKERINSELRFYSAFTDIKIDLLAV